MSWTKHAKRTLGLLAACAAWGPFGGALGHAEPPEQEAPGMREAQQDLAEAQLEYVPDELLVKFVDEGPDAAIVIAAQLVVDAQELKAFPAIGVRLWRLGPGVSVEQALEVLSWPAFADAVDFAEPNYIVHAIDVPNDPRFGEQWALHNTGQTGGIPDADIDAPEAWAVTTGSASVVVAVTDTGIDYGDAYPPTPQHPPHEDLAANIWTNPGESGPDAFGNPKETNGIDDDGNGYIDDVHGWNFHFAGSEYENKMFDDNGHGTHVSGTLGAVGDNGIGVAGVNWTVTIMPVKMMGRTATGTVAHGIEAVLYAASFEDEFGNKIVRIINASWSSGTHRSDALEAAIASSGALFVAGAGNAGRRNRSYPAAYDLPNIISVAATDHNDELADFSSWHPTAVDLAAPGVEILSTVPTYECYFCVPGNHTGYESEGWSGTSMASPHVAGVAALVMAHDPTLDILAVKDLILAGVDPQPSLAGKMVTGGRLNAFAALPLPPSPGITVTPTEGLVTTEGGGTDAFTVVLNTQPTADVSIGLASSDLSEGTVSPAFLVFTATDWDLPQLVIVTGVDDAIEDGDIPYTIVTDPPDSADPDYSGLAVADVSVTNFDDDALGVSVGGISPDSMPAGTSIDVTITGSGFVADANVAFENGQGAKPSASNIVVVSGTTITATITVGTNGPPRPRVFDVRVTNVDDSTGVLVDGFTVVP